MAHPAQPRRISQNDSADDRCGALVRNAPSQTHGIVSPGAGVSVGTVRPGIVVETAIKKTAHLKHEPGHELCTVPRSDPVRIIFGDQNVRVRLAEVLTS